MSILEPQRIPLIITQENRDETTTFDARLVNGYVEKDAMGDFVYQVETTSIARNVSKQGK